jgi:hypothetical protein
MRPRGLITLLATIPLLAAAIVLNRTFWEENTRWGFDVHPPMYLRIVNLTALVGTVIGVYLSVSDFTRWLGKKRNGDGRTG